jgi:CRP-like cAMP-binding protein
MDFSQFFNYGGDDVKQTKGNFVFLADLPAEEWEHILDATQSYRFNAGDTVVTQGDATRAMYIVASGELEVVFIGEQAFLDGLPRSATVRAKTASELRMLSREDFDTLAVRYPDLARQLLLDLGRILSLRLREMMSLAMQGGR